MRIGACAAAVLVLSVAGCGHEGSAQTGARESSAAETEAPSDGVLSGPPLLTLQRPEGEVDLAAYSWCYHDGGVGGCADGAPPIHPPLTSATDPLAFTFPVEGWTFAASFRRPGPPVECERAIGVDVAAEGDGIFTVPAPVRAGRWEVQISGNSDSGGSLATTFGWITSAGSTTTPPARGDVGFLGPPSVYDDDEEIEAYGASLVLTGMPADPIDVVAELVLATPHGRATFPLHATHDDECPLDGTIALAGEHPNRAIDLSDLGDPPFLHEVLLSLDGKQYVGTGQWPDDLTPAMSNQLRLTWSPPLPAWDGSP